MIGMPDAVEPGAVPTALLEATRRALGDIDAKRQVASIEYAHIPDPEGEGSWHVYLSRDDGPGFSGFGVPAEQVSHCELLVWLADALQDDLGDDLDSASFRPLCGIHDHPAVPRCVNGEARWCCRAACDAWSAPIGTLGAAPMLVPAARATPRHDRVRVVWDSEHPSLSH